MDAAKLVPLTLLVISGLASAEPTPTVRYLMNEPVSLWDWGMRELGEYFNNLTVEGVKIGVDSVYHWQPNRIRIMARAGDPALTFKNAAEARTMCKKTLSGLRARLGIDPATGQPFSQTYGSYLSSAFSRRGYRKGNEPKKLSDELDAMTELSASFRYGPWAKGVDEFLQLGNPGLGSVLCKGALLSNEALFPDNSDDSKATMSND